MNGEKGNNGNNNPNNNNNNKPPNVNKMEGNNGKNKMPGEGPKAGGSGVGGVGGGSGGGAFATNNIDAFNTEDFLARVNMNDKIHNILRSPHRTAGGVRQRSVYTAINPSSSRFNANAAPFVSQQQRAQPMQQPQPQALAQAQPQPQQHQHQHQPPQRSNTAGNKYYDNNDYCQNAPYINPFKNGAVITKDVPSTSAGLSGRGMPLSAHVASASSHHHFTGYEAALTHRSGPMFNNRYPIAPTPSPPVYNFDTDIRRMFPQPMPPPPFAMGRLSSNNRMMEYENLPPQPCPGSGPIAMLNGTIQLRLREGIRVDLTLDKTIRVYNQRSMVAVALSRNSSNSALIHPNGRVLQNGSKIEIVTYDGMQTNNYIRYAKMWYKGVSFTSETCALIYLVDTAGTRTTTDSFTDLTKDYTLAVFYDDARHGPAFYQEANDVVQNSAYNFTDDGMEIFDINGFRITQAADGLVKVTRGHNKCLIRTSPGNGSVTLTTGSIHSTASLGKTSHLFVRRNEKRMHFDGSCFIVRNAGHSAGFNENNLLIVY